MSSVVVVIRALKANIILFNTAKSIDTNSNMITHAP